MRTNEYRFTLEEMKQSAWLVRPTRVHYKRYIHPADRLEASEQHEQASIIYPVTSSPLPILKLLPNIMNAPSPTTKHIVELMTNISRRRTTSPDTLPHR